MPGSFGSIGLCTRAKVVCIPAKSYIKLSTREHKSNSECIEYMNSIVSKYSISQNSNNSEEIDFLEAIGYSPDKFLSIRGSFISSNLLTKGKDDNSKGLKVKYCNKIGARWFYNIAKEYHQKHNINEESTFAIPTKDYLFRHGKFSLILETLFMFLNFNLCACYI